LVMRVAICVPSTSRGYTTVYWAVAFRRLRFPEPSRVFVCQEPDLALARNRLVVEALDWGADRVFFLDDDVYPCVYDADSGDVRFDPGAPMLLLEHDAPAVTALFALRTGRYAVYRRPYDLTALDAGEARLGEVFPVEAFGAGCCVFDASVFNAVERPWFRFLVDDWDARITRSEDVYFTRRLREEGYELLCDGRVVCKHVVHVLLKHERRVEYAAVER